ncbi:hypothetical protein FRC07_014816 [Ceratobasidium sp. 392]|nr:hypothetical protein FRC07_014816 [Ceratobasidium sp. 392]
MASLDSAALSSSATVSFPNDAEQFCPSSETENTDLLWALCGGGGNFGVVTEFVFQLREQRPDLYPAAMLFPPLEIETLMSGIKTWLAGRTITETGALVFALPFPSLYPLQNGDPAEGKSKFERSVTLGPDVHQAHTVHGAAYIYPVSSCDSRHSRGSFVSAIKTGILVELVKTVYDEQLQCKSIPQRLDPLSSGREVWSKAPSNATSLEATIDEVFAKRRAKHFARELVGEGGCTSYLDEDAWRRVGSWYVGGLGTTVRGGLR